jgi:rubrerythrin
MKIEHPALVKSLKMAYSGEMAAALAYIGHAGALKNTAEIQAVNQIEQDEWNHRSHLLEMMNEYGISASKYYEIKFYLIGKIIGLSCYFIGRFMPYFFAGKLESGNVCEYFVMMKYFNSIGIHKHDQLLYEMGIKEKEHEVYFLEIIKDENWLPLFEKIFLWGKSHALNDVNMSAVLPLEESTQYCNHFKKHND